MGPGLFEGNRDLALAVGDKAGGLAVDGDRGTRIGGDHHRTRVHVVSSALEGEDDGAVRSVGGEPVKVGIGVGIVLGILIDESLDVIAVHHGIGEAPCGGVVHIVAEGVGGVAPEHIHAQAPLAYGGGVARRSAAVVELLMGGDHDFVDVDVAAVVQIGDQYGNGGHDGTVGTGDELAGDADGDQGGDRQGLVRLIAGTDPAAQSAQGEVDVIGGLVPAGHVAVGGSALVVPDGDVDVFGDRVGKKGFHGGLAEGNLKQILGFAAPVVGLKHAVDDGDARSQLRLVGGGNQLAGFAQGDAGILLDGGGGAVGDETDGRAVAVHDQLCGISHKVVEHGGGTGRQLGELIGPIRERDRIRRGSLVFQLVGGGDGQVELRRGGAVRNFDGSHGNGLAAVFYGAGKVKGAVGVENHVAGHLAVAGIAEVEPVVDGGVFGNDMDYNGVIADVVDGPFLGSQHGE